MNVIRNIFLLLVLALWGGAMAVASPAGDYDPTLPPEPYAMYQVYVSCDSAGLANLTGAGKYKKGTRVRINASSRNADYTFAYWTLNGERYNVSTAGFYYTVTAATAHFVAHFEYNPVVKPEEEYNPALPVEPTHQDPVVVTPTYPLYLVCDPSDGGSFNRTSGARVEAGARVTCTVYPNQNFTFLGWYDVKGVLLGSSRSYTYTMGNASATLVARLEYNPTMPADPTTTQSEVDNDEDKRYAVRVGSAGHGTVSISPLADSLVVGNDVTLTATPDEHYHFSHWSDGSKANPYTFQVSRNDSLTAYFALNQHLLTYQLNDEILKSTMLDYGSVITPEPIPQREHYHFLGWNNLPADLVMPDHDVTVTGSLVIDTFAVIYLVDDVLFRTDQVAYCSQIALADEPEREGYSFSGWSGYPIDFIMPDHNVTVVGHFERNMPEPVILADGTVYEASVETLAERLLYTRTFANTYWQALYVPFAIPIDSLLAHGITVARLNDTHMYDRDDDGEFEEVTLEFCRMTSGQTRANYPYLIRAAEVCDLSLIMDSVLLLAAEEKSISCSTIDQEFTFTGTYVGVSGATMSACNYYGLSAYGLARTTNINAYLKQPRWYLSISNKDGSSITTYAASLRLVIDGEWTEETSHIESVADAAAPVDAYDLHGWRIRTSDMIKGNLYVVRGKRCIAK